MISGLLSRNSSYEVGDLHHQIIDSFVTVSYYEDSFIPIAAGSDDNPSAHPTFTNTWRTLDEGDADERFEKVDRGATLPVIKILKECTDARVSILELVRF